MFLSFLASQGEQCTVHNLCLPCLVQHLESTTGSNDTDCFRISGSKFAGGGRVVSLSSFSVLWFGVFF